MKNQYFGDINDYRKYGLLRVLSGEGGIRTGVCWMLTESDFSQDGRKLRYLEEPVKWRPYDPELFDFLERVVGIENDRDVGRFEESGLLPDTTFHDELLTDYAEHRNQYFKDALVRLQEVDLVFFDPDNGMGVRSVPRGRRGSSKYLYEDELAPFYDTGHSMLVYQHFNRESREGFIQRMVESMKSGVGAAEVYAFRTSHVLFLLAVRPEHVEHFRQRAERVAVSWRGQIEVQPHADSEVSSGTAASDRLDYFTEEKYLSLKTFRRSGEGVETPLWFAEEEGLLYARTFEKTGKVKRLRHTSGVEVAPCDSRGMIKGEWTIANARMIGSEDEIRNANRLLNRKYGLTKRLAEPLFGLRYGKVVTIAIRHQE